jgi:hypothetical protein
VTTPPDPLAALLEKWSKAEQAATEGPWWYDEDENCWRLHGVALRIPAPLPGMSEQIMNKQIAKAAKRNTPYAEYWPDKADADFIVTARTAMPKLLSAVQAILKQHQPIRADGGDSDELLCGKCSFAYRTPWPCGEVETIRRKLSGSAGSDA